VRYLHDLEEANLERIPKAKGVSRLGWADAQCNTFLLGSESISLEPDPLVLIPPSAGAGQIAQALGVAGDLDKWKEAVSPMLPHPLVVAALGSSAAAPLLPILGVQNFIVDFVNQTSSGKTTLLKVAASVFGNPSTGDSAPLIASWNTTEVGFEQRASMLNGLPLFLDDSKQATVGKELSRLIYHFANGKGRNRGGIDGVANLRTWSSVLISTGESPLIAESNDGGTRVRVVTLWARPFGDLDAETGTRVRNLNRLVDRCYGLAGRAYLRHLLAAGNGELQAEFGRLESQYSQYAGENVLAQRLAPVVAVMHLGAQLLLESLDIDCDVHAAFGEIWGLVAAESKEADRADAAIEYVADWLTAHPNRMWQTEHHEESPPGGWAGTRDELGRHCFIPAVLKQILSEGSFDAEGILRTWTDRGLLSKAPSGGNPQKRFANVRSRLLTFSPDAFDVKNHTEEDGTARTTGSGRPKPSSPHRPARRPE